MAEAGTTRKLTVKGRYEVMLDQPLGAFDSPRAKAYLAMDGRGEKTTPLMAFVLDRTLPPRCDAMDAMRGIHIVGLLRLVDWGLSGSREDKLRQMCVIYDQPPGSRLVASDRMTFPAIEEEVIERAILPRIVPVLKELGSRNIAHRAIRPSNFFHAGDGKSLILGESVTSPPASDQPEFIEPLESAMADPIGRGDGSFTDDLFALGVTLLAFLIGRQPESDKSAAELMHLRLEQGSFSALAGRQTLSLPMVELLRGLMNDEPRDRWTINDIEQWLNGRRMTPNRAKLPLKAARAIVVGGMEQLTKRSLAYAIVRNWEASAQLVRSPNLDNWLRRSLLDDDVAKALTANLGATGPEPADAKTVARTGIILDPRAPISFRGYSVNIDGIGYAVAANINRTETRQKLSEILAAKLPNSWFNTAAPLRSELVRQQSLIDRMASTMSQVTPGFGYERVAYELNPYLHCLSPLIESRMVIDPDDLLPAIEAAVQDKLPSGEPLDRHVTAFIASRCRQITDKWLRPLGNESDNFARIVGQVRLLAFLQGISNNGPLPNLCRWLEIHLRPTFSQFHNLKKRKKMLEELGTAAQGGIIARMMVLVEDTQALAKDEQGYRAAVAGHGRAELQVQHLRNEVAHMDYIAAQLGEQVSAIASGVIGGLTAFGVIFFYVF